MDKYEPIDLEATHPGSPGSSLDSGPSPPRKKGKKKKKKKRRPVDPGEEGEGGVTAPTNDPAGSPRDSSVVEPSAAMSPSHSTTASGELGMSQSRSPTSTPPPATPLSAAEGTLGESTHQSTASTQQSTVSGDEEYSADFEASQAGTLGGTLTALGSTMGSNANGERNASPSRIEAPQPPTPKRNDTPPSAEGGTPLDALEGLAPDPPSNPPSEPPSSPRPPLVDAPPASRSPASTPGTEPGEAPSRADSLPAPEPRAAPPAPPSPPATPEAAEATPISVSASPKASRNSPAAGTPHAPSEQEASPSRREKERKGKGGREGRGREVREASSPSPSPGPPQERKERRSKPKIVTAECECQTDLRMSALDRMPLVELSQLDALIDDAQQTRARLAEAEAALEERQLAQDAQQAELMEFQKEVEMIESHREEISRREEEILANMAETKRMVEDIAERELNLEANNENLRQREEDIQPREEAALEFEDQLRQMESELFSRERTLDEKDRGLAEMLRRERELERRRNGMGGGSNHDYQKALVSVQLKQLRLQYGNAGFSMPLPDQPLLGPGGKYYKHPAKRKWDRLHGLFNEVKKEDSTIQLRRKVNRMAGFFQAALTKLVDGGAPPPEMAEEGEGEGEAANTAADPSLGTPISKVPYSPEMEIPDISVSSNRELKRIYLRECELQEEVSFIAQLLRLSPVVCMNPAPTADLVKEIETWYRELTDWIEQRQTRVLAERHAYLTELIPALQSAVQVRGGVDMTTGKRANRANSPAIPGPKRRPASSGGAEVHRGRKRLPELQTGAGSPSLAASTPAAEEGLRKTGGGARNRSSSSSVAGAKSLYSKAPIQLRDAHKPTGKVREHRRSICLAEPSNSQLRAEAAQNL